MHARDRWYHFGKTLLPGSYFSKVQHVEFIHTDHFRQCYHRAKAAPELSLFIDFFWETDFDRLWSQYPDGFSDVLFPNTGYTYLINLGTPFIMQVGEKKFPMKTDGFLPRHKAIECYHKTGNRIFGIKFKTSPVIFEKKINFAEYREAIFPLSYLADVGVIKKIKAANDFKERVEIASTYYRSMIDQYSGSLLPVKIVTEILASCDQQNDFSRSVEDFAQQYNVSTRTLQRYFEIHTGISTKKVLQILRIRKAVEQMVSSPETFRLEAFHYYDHSHFYKHLRNFLRKSTLQKLQPHLKLLQSLHKP